MLGSKENLRRQIAIQVVDIESLIPEDYYLRRIDAAVYFSFIRARVAHLYSHTGRPSIDPEIAFRINVTGSAANIPGTLQQFNGSLSSSFKGPGNWERELKYC
ncbi:hypothetical protein MTJW_09870 [Moorella thermoacetica]|nr:hypothetical protein MTJW_09870 [Moorella thermoacetica]